jgi:hypothetical protein
VENETTEAEGLVYTPLDKAQLIRDRSFPHKVARALALNYGLKIARFRPRVAKHARIFSNWPGLLPQQAELANEAAARGIYILTCTRSLAVYPRACVFPAEVDNDALLRVVVQELTARGLLK